jgi:Arc/MetJ-type ribon-helix-helix transcriptional regulator
MRFGISYSNVVTMGKKIKTSVSLDEETLKWMDKQIATKKFRNKSHIMEYAIEELRKKE